MNFAIGNLETTGFLKEYSNKSSIITKIVNIASKQNKFLLNEFLVSREHNIHNPNILDVEIKIKYQQGELSTTEINFKINNDHKLHSNIAINNASINYHFVIENNEQDKIECLKKLEESLMEMNAKLMGAIDETNRKTL